MKNYGKMSECIEKFVQKGLDILMGTGLNLHSTAQHSTAQHSTAQHSTAQHSTAQRANCALFSAADKYGIEDG